MKKATKIWLIVASSLILFGVILFGGVMTLLKWDFTKLTTVKYETNEYEISENYKNISIVSQTADIKLIPSEGLETTVICHEQSKMKHLVEVREDTLVIEVVDERKWYDHINLNFKTPKITVSIPQADYGAFEVNSTTGNIRLEKMSVGNLAFSVTTGKVSVSDVECTGDVIVNVTTGRANFENLTCCNLNSSGCTGDISLKNVVGTGCFYIKRVTGDVRFDSSDASAMYIVTTTGDVTGTLLTEKVFSTKVTTGKVSVPQTTSGGACDVETTTGNIKLQIK